MSESRLAASDGIAWLAAHWYHLYSRLFPDRFKLSTMKSGATVRVADHPEHLGERVLSTGKMGYSIREQGLALETREGLVWITGCAHPGIVAMATWTQESA